MEPKTMGVAEAIAKRKLAEAEQINAQGAPAGVKTDVEADVVVDTNPYKIINVAGKNIKISNAAMEEFFQRTGHNNLGELTEADMKVIDEMNLGITAGAGDDIETLKTAQHAIGSSIIETKNKAVILQKKQEAIEAMQTPAETEVIEDPEEIGDYADYEEVVEDDFTPPQTGVSIANPKEGYAEVVEAEVNTPPSMSMPKHNFSVTDLGNIKIKAFSPKVLVKQRQHTLTHGIKTPVVALSSNIYGEVIGFTSADLVTMTNTTGDNYLDMRAKYQLIFNKLINSNVKLTYDLFLRCTSMFDQDAFFFGGFKSTYGDKINIPLTCTNPECKHAFTVTTPTDDVILSKDYVKMGDKAMEIMAMTSPEEILNDSDVNRIERNMISSYHIIDIDHPSLYTYLEKIVKLISNNTKFQDEKYASVLDLLPFINAMYVPIFDGDLKDVNPADIDYMEIKVVENDKLANNKTKLLAIADELLTLTTTQLFEVTELIQRRVESIKSRFEIGLTGVECPKCHTKASGDGTVTFNITDLLFLVSLQQAKELSMKKNTIGQ